MIADIGIMITTVGSTMKRTVMNKTITPAKGTKGFIIHVLDYSYEIAEKE